MDSRYLPRQNIDFPPSETLSSLGAGILKLSFILHTSNNTRKFLKFFIFSSFLLKKIIL